MDLSGDFAGGSLRGEKRGEGKKFLFDRIIIAGGDFLMKKVRKSP